MPNLIILIAIVSFLMSMFNGPLNNPYPASDEYKNIFYSSFSESPKTLDPAKAYSSNESLFISQIYEPPLQYHYLKRPFTLIPQTAQEVPKPTYNAKQDVSTYRIQIQPNIFYQPHPIFAKNEAGQYRYHHMNLEQNHDITRFQDFKETGTRELIAADYVYQIKRLASPKTNSPIFGLMSQYIVGLETYAKNLSAAYQSQLKFAEHEDVFLDLRQHPLLGAKVIDRYTYEVKIKGKYPQFLYWLAMPFFAPIPWEADLFYSQPGMDDRNITLDWHPVGTGPYVLSNNDPNREMVLSKNPNFRGEMYPTQGAQGDLEKGYLTQAGQTMPFVDQFVFSLEKESIPRWNKFLQGYYDQSSISSDSFDQAIFVDDKGQPHLTKEMIDHGVRLTTSTGLATYYLGFNMLDPVVGGSSERARLLRQAISIALNYEEYINIFLNGRGLVAMSPLPPDIFRSVAGENSINPYVYTGQKGQFHRKTIEHAKQLLEQAGYKAGIDPKTGEPLIIYFDVAGGNDPDAKARYSWMRKMFSKLGLQFEVRSTQYNRFQEKMRHGNAQMFSWGWLADYPDPENFLFLLYGPSGKAKYGGENASNYNNPSFDVLFEQMKNIPNSPERFKIIEKMLDILQKDSPWVWGLHPKIFTLSHSWVGKIKPNQVMNNQLKYISIDPEKRAISRAKWNQAVFWPVALTCLLIAIILLLFGVKLYIRNRSSVLKRI